jgi:uncharacterized protein YegL
VPVFILVLLGLSLGCATLEEGVWDLYQPSPVAAAVVPAAWLDVAEPRDDSVLRRVAGLVEVSGRAGLREVVDHDVVLLIDFSTSAFLPTGRDIDGDGTVGEYREWIPRVRHKYRPLQGWTTDFGDTILQTELRAAEALIAMLDSESSRAGIVTFTDKARLSMRVGHPAAAVEALDELQIPNSGGGTDLGAGIGLALRALSEASQQAATPRHQSIFVLSDGLPTAPAPAGRAKRNALQYADRVREAGVRLHAFAFGPKATGRTFFEQIASRTGGQFLWIDDLSELADHLPYIVPYTLVPGLETVMIENLSTHASASAVRVFPDGSFDAYLPLAHGANRIEVIATVAGGGEVRETRTVFYEKPEVPTRDELEAAAKLRDRLRDRTIETRLAAEVRNAGRARRGLVIEAED